MAALPAAHRLHSLFVPYFYCQDSYAFLATPFGAFKFESSCEDLGQIALTITASAVFIGAMLIVYVTFVADDVAEMRKKFQ